MQKVLEIANLSKAYGKRNAISNLSLTVNAGEIYGFIGPNGAGKTTTIKIITGLARATSGDVKICGYSIKKDFEKAIINVGAIIENPELYKYLSGQENLELFAGLYKGITRERINEVVRLVGLENRINDKIKKYSLGMRQRAGIAQSLLHNPKILILDEPTNGLDPAGIREMRDILKMLAREKGIAVFISSHILSEMEQLCDRAAIVDNGKVVKVVDLTNKDEPKEKLLNYLIKVKDTEKAVNVLNREFNELNASLKGSKVVVRAMEQDIPEFIKALVYNEIDVYGVEEQAENLESKFLDATKNSRIS